MVSKIFCVFFLTAIYSQFAVKSQQTNQPPQQQKPASGSLREGIVILSDTNGVDFRDYIARVRYAVSTNWHNLIPESAFSRSGAVIISFAILRDGRVVGMQMAKASGDLLLDRPAWGAIKTAQPFSPLPSAFHGDYLALRINFYYNPKPEEAQQSIEIQQPQTAPSPPPTKAPASPFNVPPGIDYAAQRPVPPTGEEENAPTPSQGLDILEPKGVVSYELQEFLNRRLLVILRENWINVLPDKVRGRKGKKGTSVVTFTVDKDGTIESVELEQSSGDPDLDSAVLQAVKESTPGALPAKFNGKYMKLRVKFQYNRAAERLIRTPRR